MCQVYYLRETERDFLFIIVMSPRVGNTMAFMCGEKKQNERPYFHACVFFFFLCVMITNSNKGKTSGRGYNDLFVMQIPPLSCLPKINKPKQMTICGGAQLTEAGRFFCR